MSNIKLDVRVYPLDNPQGSTKAFANVGIEDLVAINGIRVVSGEKGDFVAMPQSKDKEGNYHDIAFPINGDLRKEINKVVAEEYKRVEALPLEQRGYEKLEAKAMNELNIEGMNLEIKVYPLDNPQGSTKAFANVGIEDLVAINGIRVVSGEKGDFVAMPQSKDKDGNYHDIAFPINADLRKEMNRAVLDKYKEVAQERGQSLGAQIKEGQEQVNQYKQERAANPQEYAAAKKAPGIGD